MKHIIVASAIWTVVITALLLGAAIVANSQTGVQNGARQSIFTEKFPAIETKTLSEYQKNIITITKREWQAQPASTKYSQGVREEWCADFVSWVMRTAGLPLTNRHSGSWRIPGVYTLTEYYQSVGRFKPAGAHTPQMGDVVLYAPESIFGQHTNIVLAYENGMLTTVGGNENGKIRVQTHPLKNLKGIVGYGILP